MVKTLEVSFGVRNLAGFNQKFKDAVNKGNPLTNPFSLNPEEPEPLEEMTQIVIVIDELADLMMVMGKKIEELIARLAQRPCILGGVTIEHTHGLVGHSDADVLLHAISDALLGASGLGDIGKIFPDSDPYQEYLNNLDLSV